MASNSENIAVCSLCQKALSPENEVTSDLATNGVCGDCKFLLLEDFGYHMVTPRSQWRLRGRSGHNSSDSFDNIMVNAARQNESEDDQQQAVESLRYGSTPTGSSRWRPVLSDTDSDGYDNWSSLYGENESNASFRRYRVPHGETDSFSFSAYGGDSDISIDRHSILGIGMFDLPDDGDEFESDTDIDPMHAGLSQWNSDDTEDDDEEDDVDDDVEEEEGEEEEREWELAETEAEATARLQMFFTSNVSESRGLISESEVAQIISNLQSFTDHNYSNLQDTGLPSYRLNFGDFLDARHFEDLLEHLAENDRSRRGAPPASLSSVNKLPRIVVGKEHEKHGELVCAICKDDLAPGTEASQLPCSHLYHTCCILPWLSARNSCPLCRYELPTDDRDYEEGKQNTDWRHVTHERQQLEVVQQMEVADDSTSDVSGRAEANEVDDNSQSVVQHREVVSLGSTTNSAAASGGRGRWFFLAAAPIVSLVGIVLVLWLGNSQSQIEGSRHLVGHDLSAQNRHPVHVYASPVQRESRSRRWWCPF